LSDAQAGAEALVTAVVQAVSARDEARLRALALSEQEFRDHVWPELPAARPERNLPFSYVWGDHRQKSEQSLAGTLQREGGQPLTFVAIRFAGGPSRYPSYVVHRDSVITVRDAAGATRELRLFGSALEKNGAWKVFSYIVDED
jgi:hypothetical protein